MFIAIIAVSLIIRLAYLLFPSMVWWDPAIYIGMGKMIFSGGAIGFWEPIRPLLWPVVLGGFWKLGLDPTLAANLLEITFTLATLYLVYKLGERLYPRAGLFASALLSFTGVYFFFGTIPLTDIPSIALIVFAGWLLLSNRLYLAGLVVGLTFTMRFPQALYLLPFGLTVALANGKDIKKTILDGLKIGLGFATLAVPYLILNYVLYQDALLPLHSGNTVFLASGTKSGVFFYPWNLILQNPFFIIGFAVVCRWLYSLYGQISSKAPVNRLRLLIVLSILIIGGYFTSIGHKELRYAIAILPWLALASGYGASVLIDRHMPRFKTHSLVAISLLLIIGGVAFGYPSWKRYMTNPPLNAYYNFFTEHPNTTVIASTPQIVADADVHLVEVFDTWENAVGSLNRLKDQVDFIGVNTCQIQCLREDDACRIAKQETESQLSRLTTVFATSSHSCNFSIYSGLKN